VILDDFHKSQIHNEGLGLLELKHPGAPGVVRHSSNYAQVKLVE
jgi:hypothetical protein